MLLCTVLQVLPADMSLADTALFYARASVAAADAAIVTYKVSRVAHARRVGCVRGVRGVHEVCDVPQDALNPWPGHYSVQALC